MFSTAVTSGPDLHASIVVAPNQPTNIAIEALLNRLLYDGKAYDAHRIFLRLSETSRKLYDPAQQLGFIPIDLPRQGPHTDEGEVSVAFAVQTGT